MGKLCRVNLPHTPTCRSANINVLLAVDRLVYGAMRRDPHVPGGAYRLSTLAAIVAAALSSEFLTVPRGPPSYDMSKYERIFDTSRKSFLPADPTRLILSGGSFSDRVVCAGEMHTHPLHHRMQFEVIKAVSGVTKSRGEPLAVGLEMFYQQQQVRGVALD